MNIDHKIVFACDNSNVEILTKDIGMNVDSLYSGMESRNKVKKSYMANYELDDDDFHWNVAFLDGKQYQGQVDWNSADSVLSQ